MNTLSKIKNTDDFDSYIEGIVSDFEFGIESKQKTINMISEMVIYFSEKSMNHIHPTGSNSMKFAK